MEIRIRTILLLSGLAISIAFAKTPDNIESLTGVALNPWSISVASLAGLLILDQINYRNKKRHLPGPTWLPPLIGKLWDSINPTFEGYLKMWASGPLSCTSVFQKFIVLGSTTEISRKIFNTPGSIVPAVLPSMKDILTPNNFVFLQGEAHVHYRKQLNPLFTRKALSIYLPAQEEEYRRHISNWLKNGQKPHEHYTRSRAVAMNTSLLVFCGRYMPSEVVQRISTAFYDITAALELVNFPIPLPGTKVYKAMKARKYIVTEMEKCVQMSRDRMAIGDQEPDCLLDHWLRVQQTAKNDYEADPSGTPPVLFSNSEIALTVLTFLFASQDASNSSFTWVMALTADHPDVLAKVREEQLRLRPNDEPLTLETLDQMTYTKQVVKEVLRYRPPVLMVPHQATKPVTLTDDGYVVPSGTLLITSVWPSVHDPNVFSQPDKFDPDRFGPARQEDVKGAKNWLIFGHGPHICLGKEFVVTSLLAFLALASTMADWKHHVTDKSENIKILSTIYPADDLLLTFTPYIRNN